MDLGTDSCLEDKIVKENKTEGIGEELLPPLQRLEKLRLSIDNIDAALIYLLAERFKYTKEVGALKTAYGMPAQDPVREKQQVARLRELAVAADLDADFAEKILAFILKEVIQNHRQIRPKERF